MTTYEGLKTEHQPDADALIANILRQGTPRRVHHIELFHDGEIRLAIAEYDSLVANHPHKDKENFNRWGG